MWGLEGHVIYSGRWVCWAERRSAWIWRRAHLQTPALNEIRLTCPDDADDSYKSQCTKLAAEMDKANVALELTKEFVTIIGENDGEEWLVEEEP